MLIFFHIWFIQLKPPWSIEGYKELVCKKKVKGWDAYVFSYR